MWPCSIVIWVTWCESLLKANEEIRWPWKPRHQKIPASQTRFERVWQQWKRNTTWRPCIFIKKLSAPLQEVLQKVRRLETISEPTKKNKTSTYRSSLSLSLSVCVCSVCGECLDGVTHISSAFRDQIVGRVYLTVYKELAGTYLAFSQRLNEGSMSTVQSGTYIHIFIFLSCVKVIFIYLSFITQHLHGFGFGVFVAFLMCVCVCVCFFFFSEKPAQKRWLWITWRRHSISTRSAALTASNNLLSCTASWANSTGNDWQQQQH